MNVNIKLIILHLNLQTKTSSCLLDDDQIISRPLLDENIGNGLRDILLEYLTLEPEWVRFNLVDVIHTTKNISMIYSCMIPTIIKNHKGTWVNLGEIDDTDIKRLVFQASQKIPIV